MNIIKLQEEIEKFREEYPSIDLDRIYSLDIKRENKMWVLKITWGENLDYITSLINENLRLQKIEEKYNAILENIS